MTSSHAPDPWHYARPALAQAYLKVFDIGLTSAKGLFAKRRMGKSEFLEQDLIPAARDAGYLTAYLNLWDARHNPGPALVDALVRATAPTGLAKLMKRLNAPLKKVKASGKLPGLAEGALEAELTDGTTPEVDVLGQLSEVLRQFDRKEQKLLLVLDEAQVLADIMNADLAHALRAGLDGRKQRIKVVFAGSSEPTLRRMFGRATEPFYNWAPLEPFELLGADFVSAMVEKVNVLSRFPLEVADAQEAFSQLQQTPEFFRRYLSRYLEYALLGAQAALEDTKAHVFNDRNFRAYWDALVPTDREMLRLLAEGVSDLHSANTRARLATALGLGAPVSKATPQHALRRLQEAGMVARMDYGVYQLQDDAFAEWLRHRELDT